MDEKYVGWGLEDYDYFYRMIVKKRMKGISTKKNEITGIFRRGGFSSTISFRKLFIKKYSYKNFE